MFKSQLMTVKQQLVDIINDKHYEIYDEEQLEYLIQLIDWLLLGEIELTTKSVETLMEEIVITSVHQLNLSLLDTLNTLGQIQRKLYDSKIQL